MRMRRMVTHRVWLYLTYLIKLVNLFSWFDLKIFEFYIEVS